MADSEQDKIETIAGYPPEVVMQMLSAGSITRRQAELAEEMADSRGMRDMMAPGLTRAGRTVHAASPLSHLARGLRQYKGNKDLKAGKEEMVGLDEKYESGMADALRAYGRRQDVTGRGGTIQPEGAATFPMDQPQQVPGGGQAIPSNLPPQMPPQGGQQMPPQMPPQGPLPQPPPMNIPPSGIQAQQAGPGPDLSGAVRMDQGDPSGIGRPGGLGPREGGYAGMTKEKMLEMAALLRGM